MSYLPEKGEAERACRALDNRAELVIGRTDRIMGVGDIEINMADGSADGDGMDAYRKVYGDLFDLGETLQATRDLIDGFMLEIARTGDAYGVITSLFLQGVGLGAMMERQRWEQRP